MSEFLPWKLDTSRSMSQVHVMPSEPRSLTLNAHLGPTELLLETGVHLPAAVPALQGDKSLCSYLPSLLLYQFQVPSCPNCPLPLPLLLGPLCRPQLPLWFQWSPSSLCMATRISHSDHRLPVLVLILAVQASLLAPSMRANAPLFFCLLAFKFGAAAHHTISARFLFFSSSTCCVHLPSNSLTQAQTQPTGIDAPVSSTG